MIRIIFPLCALLWAGLAQAAETPTVMQSYNCTFNAGKGMNDLDSAVEYYQSQVAKMDQDSLKGSFDAVVTPIVSNSAADFYWFAGSANLNTFAKGAAAFQQDKAAQAVVDRFQKVSTCKSNLFFTQPIYVGTPSEGGDGEGVLEGYGCTLKNGKTMANVEAFEAAMQDHSKSMGAKYNVYRWNPWLANIPADLVYLVGHDDLASFGSSNTESFTSPNWPGMSRQLNSIMDCTGGLYSFTVVRMPPAE